MMADLTLGGYAIDVQPIGVSFDLIEADQPAGVIACWLKLKLLTASIRHQPLAVTPFWCGTLK
jgi:hypothetical protein